MSVFGNSLDNSATFLQLFDSNGVQRVRGVQAGAFEAVDVYNSSGTQAGQIP